MRKMCISKDWRLSAPGINGFKTVDLPNDYSITIPRDRNAPGKISYSIENEISERCGSYDGAEL